MLGFQKNELSSNINERIFLVFLLQEVELAVVEMEAVEYWMNRHKISSILFLFPLCWILWQNNIPIENLFVLSALKKEDIYCLEYVCRHLKIHLGIKQAQSCFGRVLSQFEVRLRPSAIDHIVLMLSSWYFCIWSVLYFIWMLAGGGGGWKNYLSGR